MQKPELINLIQQLTQQTDIPSALPLLMECDDEVIKETAQALSGHFALAQSDDKEKIYYLFEQENEQGEQEEFVEFIMNSDDSINEFILWFFTRFFDIEEEQVMRYIEGKSY